MKFFFRLFIFIVVTAGAFQVSAQAGKDDSSAHKTPPQNFYTDVHHLEPSKVNLKTLQKHTPKIWLPKKNMGTFYKILGR